MSSTTMYAAPRDGSFELIAGFPNAWGSAAFIFNQLCEHYFGDRRLWEQEKGQQKLWGLAKDPRLQNFEKEVLVSTFDHILVDRPNFNVMAMAFRLFVGRYPPNGQVCHLLGQAEIFEALALGNSIAHGAKQLDFEPFAVGWRQTSVSDNHWWVHDDADAEDGRPYDLSRDKSHLFLYEELDKQGSKVLDAGEDQTT